MGGIQPIAHTPPGAPWMCLVLGVFRVGLACTSPSCGPRVSPMLAPQGLMHSSGPVGRHRQLVLVLEGELYLIPFALLKGSSSNEYLYERFALIAVPSIRALGLQSKVRLAGGRPVAATFSGPLGTVSGQKGSEAIGCGLFRLLIAWLAAG